MAQVIWDDLANSPGTMTPDIIEEPEADGSLPVEQSTKSKGRRRLLKSLKRMSSSPSLARFGRPSSSFSTYTIGGKASMSCVSLTSSSSRHTHSYGQSFSSQTSAAFSTAPTSVASTPSHEIQEFENSRLRRVDQETVANTISVPKSVPLPSDIRPASKDAWCTLDHRFVIGESCDQPAVDTQICPEDTKIRKSFRFWEEMPGEIRVHILRFLGPRELVQCSLVSRAWHEMCFDGQMWVNLNTDEYYQQIPASALTRIMTKAGPFMRDLNLRGCIQMPERWGTAAHSVSNVCRNIENMSLEGCRIDRSSIHHLLIRNTRLVHLNLCGLKDISNSAMKIIGQGCPHLEYLNVSWCQNVDTRGLLRVVQACALLKDLRAGEVRGFDDKEFLLELFNRNTLERLIVSHCIDLDDESLRLLVQGENPKIDPLTEQALVPPRKFRHLDLSRCKGLTARGVQSLAYQVPDLVGFQLSHCRGMTDDALKGIFETAPCLTHLDLEELDELTNSSLQDLAKSPCSSTLQHLNISYCENMGDQGMLQVLRTCHNLRSIVMDNTRVSDLVLTEAAAQSWIRDRSRSSVCTSGPPRAALHIVVYDCQHVTWTGVREILSRNTEANRREVISLKCFYGYQDTVNEHMKRVLRGDARAAARLERKWAEYMIASEEAGAAGAGARRRRRRLREAAMVHADEEEGGPRNGRRRARSSGCAVM